MKRNLLWAAVLAVAAAGDPRASHAADAVKVVIPDNSVLVLNWMGAKEAGVFAKHNIDADIDVRPFAGYLASLPAKQTPATSYSGLDAIGKMNDGLDLQMIGGGLTVFQEVFVRKNSPIKTVADLKGKKFGVWATGSGAFKAARVAMIDAANVDVMKDSTIVQLAPPALFKLLERGDIDAMLNISTFSINATAEPDKYRSIFSPNDYWQEEDRLSVGVLFAAGGLGGLGEGEPDSRQELHRRRGGVLSMAREPGKLRRRCRKVRQARGRDHARGQDRVQEMAGREEGLPVEVGSEGDRFAVAVPRTCQDPRRPRQGAVEERARP